MSCVLFHLNPHRVFEAIRFLALIQAARASELPIQRPFDLYGAAAQQCLSAIASDGGRFTRIADLCTLFEHHPHLSRNVCRGHTGRTSGKWLPAAARL